MRGFDSHPRLQQILFIFDIFSKIRPSQNRDLPWEWPHLVLPGAWIPTGRSASEQCLSSSAPGCNALSCWVLDGRMNRLKEFNEFFYIAHGLPPRLRIIDK